MAGRRATTFIAVLAAAGALLVATGGDSVQAAPRSVHFVAAGDYSAGSAAQSVLTGMGASGAELALALGDLSYGSGGQEQSFCDLVTSKVGAGFPFELISGNHESNGQNGSINDFGACLPNQLPGVHGTYGRQWYVDYPATDPTVRFVMVSPGLTYPDGAWSYAVGSPRYTWTSDAIDSAHTANIPWVVLGMHKPCVSVGEYACESDLRALTNLALAKKVDLVLTGHEHLYQRTKQLKLGPGCTTLATNTYDADCVADADDALVKGAGTVVTTVGTGGIALRDVDPTDAEAAYFAQYQGANTANSYGYLDVVADATTLTARFVPRTGAFSDTFVITQGTEPPANVAPSAIIATPQCSALACSFDGSGSTDSDGSIASYAWTFGDDLTDSSPSPQHVYAGPGTYPVTLTVTDDDGAPSTATTSVTVSAQTAAFAADAFERTVSNTFGVADVGGTWSSNGGSVSGGEGRLRMGSAGSGPSAYLGAATSTSTDLTMTVSVDKAASGSGTYVWVRGRRVPGAGDYRTRLWWQAGGLLRISLARTNAASTETGLPGSALLAGGVSPGDHLRVRMQVTGTSPTTLSAKVWKVGQSEPTDWMVSSTDATPALQDSGYVGLTTYLSGSATNAPVVVSVDDVQATTP